MNRSTCHIEAAEDDPSCDLLVICKSYLDGEEPDPDSPDTYDFTLGPGMDYREEPDCPRSQPGTALLLSVSLCLSAPLLL